MPAQILLSPGPKPESHEAAVIGRVRLDDPHERDSRSGEPVGDGHEGRFVGDGQHDRMGALLQVTRTRLPSGVNEVRGEDAERQVSADDDVVEGKRRRGRFDRFTVAATTCSEAYGRFLRLSSTRFRTVSKSAGRTSSKRPA